MASLLHNLAWRCAPDVARLVELPGSTPSSQRQARRIPTNLQQSQAAARKSPGIDWSVILRECDDQYFRRTDS